jgi:hypothetical protein
MKRTILDRILHFWQNEANLLRRFQWLQVPVPRILIGRLPGLIDLEAQFLLINLTLTDYARVALSGRGRRSNYTPDHISPT